MSGKTSVITGLMSGTLDLLFLNFHLNFYFLWYSWFFIYFSFLQPGRKTTTRMTEKLLTADNKSWRLVQTTSLDSSVVLETSSFPSFLGAIPLASPGLTPPRNRGTPTFLKAAAGSWLVWDMRFLYLSFFSKKSHGRPTKNNSRERNLFLQPVVLPASFSALALRRATGVERFRNRNSGSYCLCFSISSLMTQTMNFWYEIAALLPSVSSGG